MSRESHAAAIYRAAVEASEFLRLESLSVGTLVCNSQVAPQGAPEAPLQVVRAAYVMLARANPETNRAEVCVMTRRADTEKFPGARDLPGGKAEAGESLDAAAARECLEETGYAPRAGLGSREVLAWTPADDYNSAGAVFVDFVASGHVCAVAEPDKFAKAEFVDLVELVRLAADPAAPFKPDVRKIFLDIRSWRL
jgi:8-oxo-dGTP pyrophosphatase MutT (NUDIX family)